MRAKERFPGYMELLENIERWPKKPRMNERHTLSEQRDIIRTLIGALFEAWNRAEVLEVERRAALRSTSGKPSYDA